MSGVIRLQGREVCLLRITGARSGKSRTVPLMHVSHGDNVIVLSSQGGRRVRLFGTSRSSTTRM